MFYDKMRGNSTMGKIAIMVVTSLQALSVLYLGTIFIIMNH